eukprot:TRINITY_DN1200_c0_g2_i18.p1 TRINITY_DN1200_c0_g2~~TRINITY_DN1200_c0_g2_i18.p1  ORF type:complete len:360 (-),score=58.64 TRINITY_DN1200_c0_g2_i18:101-1180(-)
MSAVITFTAGCVGVDAGGSLTKLVYFRPRVAPVLPDYVLKDDLPNSMSGLQPDTSLDFDYPPQGTLRFIKIPSHKNLHFLSFVKDKQVQSSFKGVCCTGGGAFKFQTDLERLDIPLYQIDEFVSLVTGLNFVLRPELFREEVFSIEISSFQRITCPISQVTYPFLFVNMGSGVSILKIIGTGGNDFVRVSGSSLGGGTFWGLSSLLTHTSDFNVLRNLAPEGDGRSVDLLVGDIYGQHVDKISHLGLAPDILACSFGKVATERGDQSHVIEYKSEDIASSLQNMIAVNIAQIAFLNAKLHGIDHVFFAGGFIQDSPSVKQRLVWGIDFWSKGTMKALFLHHDGYLGALGAMLGPGEKIS